MSFRIIPKGGHVELHINGKFYCSADNTREAIKEYNEYVKGRLKLSESKSSSQVLQRG